MAGNIKEYGNKSICLACFVFASRNQQCHNRNHYSLISLHKPQLDGVMIVVLLISGIPIGKNRVSLSSTKGLSIQFRCIKYHASFLPNAISHKFNHRCDARFILRIKTTIVTNNRHVWLGSAKKMFGTSIKIIQFLAHNEWLRARAG